MMFSRNRRRKQPHEPRRSAWRAVRNDYKGGMSTRSELAALLAEVRKCTVCVDHLPLGPRPVVQLGTHSRIVIIGQAPGRRVHESGVPWDDASGERLRDWLNLTPDQFYEPDLVALIPMGFCYPGSAKSGDRPPRKECAPLWHDRLFGHLPEDRLTVVIGAHAQRRYMPDRAENLTATVARWKQYLPDRIVLPHPSPRNRHWTTANPWFESDTLPAVRARIAEFVLG